MLYFCSDVPKEWTRAGGEETGGGGGGISYGSCELKYRIDQVRRKGREARGGGVKCVG